MASSQGKAKKGRQEMPEREKLIARINGMKDEGVSFRQIAERLNEEGIPTISGVGAWRHIQVKRLIEGNK
jgi:hypothetical protein